MDKKSAFVGVQFYSFVRKHSYVPTHFFSWNRGLVQNVQIKHTIHKQFPVNYYNNLQDLCLECITEK